MMHAGIDGCKGGWVVAMMDEHRQLHLSVARHLNELKTGEAGTIYIDMPLHFASHRYRACEVAARQALGARKRASIFLTPCREAVEAETFAAANQLNKAQTGKGVSLQAWHIFPKIREAVAFAALYQHLPLREAHPELCFAYLNGGVALPSKKNTPPGKADRMRLIEKFCADGPVQIEAFLAATKRAQVKPDDVLDATVLCIRAAAQDVQAVLPPEQEYFDGNLFF